MERENAYPLAQPSLDTQTDFDGVGSVLGLVQWPLPTKAAVVADISARLLMTRSGPGCSDRQSRDPGLPMTTSPDRRVVCVLRPGFETPG
jgi:hypothetical protein